MVTEINVKLILQQLQPHWLWLLLTADIGLFLSNKKKYCFKFVFQSETKYGIRSLEISSQKDVCSCTICCLFMCSVKFMSVGLFSNSVIKLLFHNLSLYIISLATSTISLSLFVRPH